MNQKKWMMAAGIFLLVLTIVLMSKKKARESKRWVAYLYAEKNPSAGIHDLPDEFKDELECRSEAERALKNQANIEFSSYLCGRGCHSDNVFGSPTISEIVCAEKFISLFHGR